jgi:hypothetical protein
MLPFVRKKLLLDCDKLCSNQVEALAVQLTQREGELIYEKAEVKKLASFLKQVYTICELLNWLFANV